MKKNFIRNATKLSLRISSRMYNGPTLHQPYIMHIFKYVYIFFYSVHVGTYLQWWSPFLHDGPHIQAPTRRCSHAAPPQLGLPPSPPLQSPARMGAGTRHCHTREPSRRPRIEMQTATPLPALHPPRNPLSAQLGDDNGYREGGEFLKPAAQPHTHRMNLFFVRIYALHMGIYPHICLSPSLYIYVCVSMSEYVHMYIPSYVRRCIST